MKIKTYTYILASVFLTIISCENENKNPFQKIDKECLSNSDCAENQECSEDGKCVDVQNDGILPENDEDIIYNDADKTDAENEGDTETDDTDSEIDPDKDIDGDESRFC